MKATAYSGIRALADFIRDVTKYQQGVPALYVFVLSGVVAEEWQQHYLRTQFVLISFFIFFASISTLATHGVAIPSSTLFTQERVL